MSERTLQRVESVKAQQDEYIRSVVQTSPADQIARAKELLDAGAITPQELDALKAKALA